MIFGEGWRGEVGQPGRDHAAAPPSFGNVGDIEIEAMFRREPRDTGVLEDVESLRIGLHQAVFDAVVDHLDEVAGTDGTGVDIALLDARIASLPPAGARN